MSLQEWVERLNVTIFILSVNEQTIISLGGGFNLAIPQVVNETLEIKYGILVITKKIRSR